MSKICWVWQSVAFTTVQTNQRPYIIIVTWHLRLDSLITREVSHNWDAGIIITQWRLHYCCECSSIIISRLWLECLLVFFFTSSWQKWTSTDWSGCSQWAQGDLRNFHRNSWGTFSLEEPEEGSSERSWTSQSSRLQHVFSIYSACKQTPAAICIHSRIMYY